MEKGFKQRNNIVCTGIVYILRLLACLIPIKKYRRRCRNFLKRQLKKGQFEKIEQGFKATIERIRTTSKNQKIRVGFLVSENQKWNCQSIYEEMAASIDFEPVILITGNYSDHYKDFGKYYTSVQENYEFFASKGMNVEYAYDLEENEFLPLDKFSLDIIFYQQPWAIHPIQDIPETSAFALACYVPYGVCVIDCPTDYDQNFYRMLWHQYWINEILYNHFKSQCSDLPENYQIVGHPKLDTYLNYDANDTEGYIIYAPHHSFAPSHLNFATFKWNGEFILEYAKNHPDLKFVFKPHPQLKTRLIVRNIMTEQEVDAYFEEWKKIAVYCNTADYYDLFKKSRLMITDCSSFLGEYFPSTHPVINLKNKNSIPLNPFGQAITDCYYKVYNLDELKKTLSMLIDENKDPLREKRLAKLAELNLLNTPASTRILNLLREQLIKG